VYRAKDTFWAPDNRRIVKGDLVAPHDPVVTGRENLFEAVVIPQALQPGRPHPDNPATAGNTPAPADPAGNHGSTPPDDAGNNTTEAKAEAEDGPAEAETEGEPAPADKPSGRRPAARKPTTPAAKKDGGAS